MFILGLPERPRSLAHGRDVDVPHVL
jgi:hypothetical protein